MPATAIIPARLESTRFPGKVLASETGRPLIQHVWEAASSSASIDRVVVATDAREIAEAVAEFGGEWVMTSADHPNGTSRLAEAADRLELPDDACVVNVQGDEPEISPGLIDLLVATLAEASTPVATIASPFAPGQAPSDANIVKVVCDLRGRALYFSRSPIPHRRADAESGSLPLKHVGLYAYRAGFLRTYVNLCESPAELSERLEQLRVLEHGHQIAVGLAEAHHVGIDTPEQYRAFVARWRSAEKQG